jgi:tryptophan synthase beta subunit
LAESGRVSYESATDDEALSALYELGRHEGILPALESSHALVGARRWLAAHPGSSVLVGLSGRGDKDIDILRGLAQ